MGRITDTLVLTERQIAILQAVVEEYVATAQPVGSSAIADRPDISASPATVRNEMAYLEDAGLLLQPHTSAGRIPTDLGYRYYVDHLLTHYQLHRPGTAGFPSQREPGLMATCKMLGELTKYTTLALVPGWQEHRLLQIELAPVGDTQLLAMLVTNNRQVLHSLTTVPDLPSPARLRQLNDLLNKEFAGKPLKDLTDEALTQAVAKLPHDAGEFIHQAPEMVRRGLEADTAAPRVYLEGTTHLFEQQDFADMPKLRLLMEALHEESVFERLFSRTETGEVKVSIGAENPHQGLRDCAIVFTSYQIAEGATGGVGLIGPKRMPYRRIIRTFDAVVHNLDKRLDNTP